MESQSRADPASEAGAPDAAETGASRHTSPQKGRRGAPTPQQTPEMRQTRSASRMVSPVKGTEHTDVLAAATTSSVPSARRVVVEVDVEETATSPTADRLRTRRVTGASSPERLDIVLSATELAEFEIPVPAVPRRRSRVERPPVTAVEPPVDSTSHTGHAHSDEERRRRQERSRSPRSRRHSRSTSRSERHARSPTRAERRSRSPPRSGGRQRSPLRSERHQRSPPRSGARSRSPRREGRESGGSHSSRHALH